MKIISKIKTYSAIKLLRKRKWKRHANRYLLPVYDMNRMNQNNISKKEILQQHLEKFPDEADKRKFNPHLIF